MNPTRVRALWLLALWTLAAIGFAATIFYAGGPAHYSEASIPRVVGAAFLALGLLGTPLLRLILRLRADKGQVLQDERDRMIESKATSIGLVIIMLIVFLTCIGLWESHQEDGCVPVGWMWVLAYASLILSHLVPVIASLLMDLGVVPCGES